MTDSIEPATLSQEPEELPFIERKNIHPLLFAFACLAIVFVLYQVVGGVVTYLFAGGAKVNRENVNALRTFTLIGQVLLIFLPTILLARLLTRDRKEVFRLRAPSWKESVSAAVALLSLQRILEVYVYVQDYVLLPDFLRKILEPIRQLMEDVIKVLVRTDTVGEFLFVVAVVAVVPAIVEEFLFRGLVQKSFERTMNPLAAATLAGAIFGVFHFNPFELIPLICIGGFLGVLRFRSASIVLPVLMHFLNNFLAVVASTFHFGEQKIMIAPATDQPGAMFLVIQFVVFGALFGATMRIYFRVTERLAGVTQ